MFKRIQMVFSYFSFLSTFSKINTRPNKHTKWTHIFHSYIYRSLIPFLRTIFCKQILLWWSQISKPFLWNLTWNACWRESTSIGADCYWIRLYFFHENRWQEGYPICKKLAWPILHSKLKGRKANTYMKKIDMIFS